MHWLGTALLLAVAIHGAARLVVAGRGPDLARDAAHVLMAAGLAAMLAPPGDPLPAAAWEAVFGLVVAWALLAIVRARGRDERLEWTRHGLAGLAMIYMFAMPMAAAALTWALVACCAGWAAWSALTAAGVAPPARAQLATAAGSGVGLLRTWVLAPRATHLCDAVMAGSMTLMLLAMR